MIYIFSHNHCTHLCVQIFFYVIVVSLLQNLIMRVEIHLIQPFKLMFRRTSPFTFVEVLSFFAEFIYAVYLIYSSCIRGTDPTCHLGTCFCSRSATAWIEWSWSMTAVRTRPAPDTRCLLSNSRTLRSLIKTLCYRSRPARHTHTRVIELCVSGPISPPWSQSVWRPTTALLFLSEGTGSSGCWVFPVQLPDPVWPLPCFSFDTDAQASGATQGYELKGLNARHLCRLC